MVFRGTLGSRAATLSVKDTSISLAFEAAWVAAWDFGGRLYSLWRGGETYRRGLSGRLLFKPGRSAQARRRVPLEGADADRVVRETAEQAALLARSLDRDSHAWVAAGGRHPSDDVTAIVARCARFDPAAARDDAARFAEVYSPIGILPPDQYLSTVLQATDGCSFGTCTFCDLYHGGYRVKSAEEFGRHVAAVRDYLGESALLRGRSFFLGSANALAVPIPRLLEFFEAMPGPFGGGARPVNAFVDGFTGIRKSAGDYAELRRRGLGRVYVGLESGHDPLLAFVRKPATRDQAVETVRAIKAGGAQVGVIVMIGLGGRAFAGGHVRDTVSALNQMGLGAGDLLFFSELIEVPGTAYPLAAAAASVEPMPADERMAQAEAIRTGLVFEGPPPQLAKYDVREFIY
jgi:Radical SAM superfamily